MMLYSSFCFELSLFMFIRYFYLLLFTFIIIFGCRFLHRLIHFNLPSSCVKLKIVSSIQNL